MSASTVKALRRDLRRAVGQDALATIGEAQTNIETLVQSVGLAHERIDAAEGWMRMHDTCFYADLAWLQQHRRLTVWQRLRWLVTGR